ncbi:MAG: SPOR domain-containing protein [Candidatus Omnitrophica bacterium]|nr:SPOR domain-containing protein [Candidatus Omnitrophota bacterium]
MIAAADLSAASANASTRDQDAQGALEKIETLILEDDFPGARAKCDRFFGDFARSKLAARVGYLKDIADKKIGGYMPDSGAKQYIVQTGAFKTRDNAVQLCNELKRKGFDTIIVSSGTLYKVQLGRFNSRQNAQKLMQDLSRKGYESHLADQGSR